MSEAPKSLLDLTDVPMDEILKNCDLTSGIALQKTCVSLRNFIEDRKPDLNMMSIRMQDFGSLKTSMNYFIYPELPFEQLTLNYVKGENNCTITTNKRQKIVEGEDPITLCLGDFEALMRSRSLSMRTLCVELSEEPAFTTGLSEILQRNGPISVADLFITACSQEQILAIFRNVNPLSLNTIEIDTPGEKIVQLDINQLINLPQWTNAIKLKTWGIEVTELPVNRLAHFYRFSIRCANFDRETLMAIKQLFQSDDEDRHFTIILTTIPNIHHLISTSLDPSNVVVESENVRNEYSWRFQVPADAEKILLIRLRIPLLSFHYIPKSMLTERAVVLD